MRTQPFFFLLFMSNFLYYIWARTVSSNKALDFGIWNCYPEGMCFLIFDCGQDLNLCTQGSLGSPRVRSPTVPWQPLNENLAIGNYQTQAGSCRRINFWVAIQEMKDLRGCNTGFAIIGSKCHSLPHHHGPQDESFSYPEDKGQLS